MMIVALDWENRFRFAAITQVGDLESLRGQYTELFYLQSSEICDGHKL
jgi:hypothetical protein